MNADHLVLEFAGWFQCRLATNPDPTDEPRGVSGHTFALPGEPDLDRVIRFQEPVAPRSHGPRVAVEVGAVSRGGESLSDHPLLRASVDLLDGPKFESRNLLLTDDRAGVGLIHPFHLEVKVPGLVVRRRDLVDPDAPDQELHRVAPELLNRRAPVDLNGMIMDPERIAEVTGITDGLEFRARRREALETDLAGARDPVVRAALEKRIRDLRITHPRDLRLISLQATQTRRFALNGPVEIHDAAGRLEPVDADRDWPIGFWMGGWDSDSLCGYVKGRLAIALSGG